MPTVKGKKFPYTAKGKADAKAYAKKKKAPPPKTKKKKGSKKELAEYSPWRSPNQPRKSRVPGRGKGRILA